MDGIIYVLCEHEAPCTSAGPVVSFNGNPYMATIEPVCYVVINTPHTLNIDFHSYQSFFKCSLLYKLPAL